MWLLPWATSTLPQQPERVLEDRTVGRSLPKRSLRSEQGFTEGGGGGGIFLPFGDSYICYTTIFQCTAGGIDVEHKMKYTFDSISEEIHEKHMKTADRRTRCRYKKERTDEEVLITGELLTDDYNISIFATLCYDTSCIFDKRLSQPKYM